MGIQINGQTDNISAVDGSLTISGADMTVSAGSTSAPSISPSGDSNTGIFFPSPDTIAFAEGGAEGFRLDSSGNVSIANGNLVFSTSGKGIDFSATTDSSGTMTSELLDDYERGSWTPTLVSRNAPSGSLGYTNDTGAYVKIGNLVFVSAFLTWTSGSISGTTVQLAGLPFASGPNITRGGFNITYSSSGWVTGATIYQQAFRNENSESNAIYNFSDATDGKMNSTVNGSQISSTGEVMISGCYTIG
jgi:hypothetical protein